MTDKILLSAAPSTIQLTNHSVSDYSWIILQQIWGAKNFELSRNKFVVSKNMPINAEISCSRGIKNFIGIAK